MKYLTSDIRYLICRRKYLKYVLNKPFIEVYDIELPIIIRGFPNDFFVFLFKRQSHFLKHRVWRRRHHQQMLSLAPADPAKTL